MYKNKINFAFKNSLTQYIPYLDDYPTQLGPTSEQGIPRKRDYIPRTRDIGEIFLASSYLL